MTKSRANRIITVLGIVGTLFILAGPAFNVIASNTGLFLGIACFVVAGGVRAFVKSDG